MRSHNPTARLSDFGQIRTTIPAIIANIADRVNDIKNAINY